jgi:hypothetical protein
MSLGAVATPLGFPQLVVVIGYAVAVAAVLAVSLDRGRILAPLAALVSSRSRLLLVLAVVAAVADRHAFVSSSAPATDDILGLCVVIAAIVLPRTRRATVALAAFALGAYVMVGAVLIFAKPYQTDAVVATHGAAELLLHGRHPYADFDLVDQLARFGLPEAYATPLEDGTRLRTFDYPALAALLPAPFLAAGLADVRPIYLVLVTALIAAAALAVPVRWRLAVLAAGIGNAAILDQFVLAGVDPAWALLLAVAWLARARRWSALAIGLALVDRQQAWAVAPFLLAWAGRAHGRREGAVRGGIALAVAAIVQLPFFVTAPVAVVHGLTDVIVLPLEERGVGLSALFVAAPRGVFLALAAAAYLALLWAAATRRIRGALAVALLPLWLAWRALQSYFAFAGIFAVLDGLDER